MKNLLTAIIGFFLGPGDWIVFFALVAAAYYLAKN
jgi:hypothetical protein